MNRQKNITKPVKAKPVKAKAAKAKAAKAKAAKAKAAKMLINGEYKMLSIVAVRMNFLCVLIISVLLLPACTSRTVNTKGNMTEKMTETKICLIAGLPEKKFAYEIIKAIKFGKGSYGRVDDSIPELINQAKVLGADAIINYQGSQRFGFWPWRITRPVLRGDAINWVSHAPVKCEDAGGVAH